MIWFAIAVAFLSGALGMFALREWERGENFGLDACLSIFGIAMACSAGWLV